MNPKRGPGEAPPSGTPILPAVWNLPGRCWSTTALLCWLPLVKWGLPSGVPRTALFYGGGMLLSLVALRPGGGWPRVRPLFRAPVTGLASAVSGFTLLMACSAVLLTFSWPRTLLPPALAELIAFFDPWPVYALLSGGGHGFPAAKALGWAAGAIAEEWIFRVALLWRWVATEKYPEIHGGKNTEEYTGEKTEEITSKNACAEVRSPARIPHSGRVDTLLQMGIKLTIVSAYFAALHWPQSSAQLAAAFLGAMAVGALLLRWRNFYLISMLHILFNWKALSRCWGM